MRSSIPWPNAGLALVAVVIAVALTLATVEFRAALARFVDKRSKPAGRGRRGAV